MRPLAKSKQIGHLSPREPIHGSIFIVASRVLGPAQELCSSENCSSFP
jgi:hypothetical protein